MNMKITTTEVVEVECTSSKLIQVIETKFARGTDEPGDPVRTVCQYWSLDGSLLAEKEQNATGAMDVLNQYKSAKSRLEMLEKHLIAMGYDIT